MPRSFPWNNPAEELHHLGQKDDLVHQKNNLMQFQVLDLDRAVHQYKERPKQQIIKVDMQRLEVFFS